MSPFYLQLHQPRQCLAGSIGQLWKKLNEAERQPYKDMAQQDQVRFKTEYADYMSMLRQGLSEKDAARAEIHAKNVQTESKTSLSVAKGPTNSGRSIGNETPPPSNPKVRLRKKARKEIDIGKVNELVGKECDLTPNLTPKDTFDGFELDDFELTPIEYPSLDDGMNTGLLDFFNPQFADNSVSPRLFGDPILFY